MNMKLFVILGILAVLALVFYFAGRRKGKRK